MNDNPITKVYLLDVPLENDYKNTLYFANAQAQQTYFQSRIIGSYSYGNFTYQRKDQIIRVPEQYDKIYNCNYVMYQNANYSNKWFYAFVTDLEYINDGRTDLHIETDVIQTWMFDYTVKASFVEREHTDDDTPGNNTVPEGLETGEYVIDSITTDARNRNTTCVVASSLTPGELINLYGGIYNGIPSGITYFRFDSIDDGVNSLQSYLNNLASHGKSDAVVGIFLAPKWLAGGSSYTSVNIPESDDAGSYTFTAPKITTLDLYEPRNQKLLTYPFCYMVLSNEQGSSALYHQELWEANQQNNVTIKVYGCLTPGCSIRAIPLNYKDAVEPFNEGVNLGKLPQLNWTTDQYTNWLTQNGVNIATNLIGNTIATTGGIATGKFDSASNGALGIANTLGEVYKHSLMPPQAEGNLNSGDVTTASDNNTFRVYNMTIRREWAERIDKYFDMFGYKVNMVKVPNKAHRSRYWYTKTINVNINGDVPQNDMQKIKSCYDNGITFWRNASDIENYDSTNNIV